MAHLKCNHCENFTDEAYPFCEDCQNLDEYDNEGDEDDDGSSYWTENDEHRTY